jgi:hypothetical protein
MGNLLSFFLSLCVISCSTTFVFKVFYFDHSCSQHCQFSDTVSHIDSFLEVTVVEPSFTDKLRTKYTPYSEVLKFKK